MTPDNPARGGETIIGYATGLPTPTPEVTIGQPTPLSPLSYVSQVDSRSSTWKIGLSLGATSLFDEVPASGNTTGLLPIPFVGLTPGTVGLFQINFVFPQGISAGNVPVRLILESCKADLFSVCGGGADTISYSQPVLIPVQ